MASCRWAWHCLVFYGLVLALLAVLAAAIRGYRASLRDRRERRQFQSVQWWGKR